jgi:DNA-directed RNA polymerase specialized sigma24 family protein
MQNAAALVAGYRKKHVAAAAGWNRACCAGCGGRRLSSARCMSADDRRPGFPSTRWSRILAPAGARDLDALARAYWRPVHAYLAARTRCRGADADDLAQEAFAWLLASGLLDKADPARGRFRGFLKSALANFAAERSRRDRAAKRGGGIAHEPLGEHCDPADARGRSPEQALDDAWRRELLTNAHARLQQELEAGGRALHWALFRDYYLADDEPDHAALAARFQITRTDVANWLDHARRRYRAILRELVAATVGSPEELADELRWLFGPGTPEAAR